MEKNTILSRSDDYLSNEIDGEVVMMNIETGTYISMNATGKSVWDLIVEPTSLAEILNSLTKEYDIAEEACKADVSPFIQQMIDQKIIRII